LAFLVVKVKLLHRNGQLLFFSVEADGVKLENVTHYPGNGLDNQAFEREVFITSYF